MMLMTGTFAEAIHVLHILGFFLSVWLVTAYSMTVKRLRRVECELAYTRRWMEKHEDDHEEDCLRTLIAKEDHPMRPGPPMSGPYRDTPRCGECGSATGPGGLGKELTADEVMVRITATEAMIRGAESLGETSCRTGMTHDWEDTLYSPRGAPDQLCNNCNRFRSQEADVLRAGVEADAAIRKMLSREDGS